MAVVDREAPSRGLRPAARRGLGARGGFRGDLDGLRAVAIVLVVLFHAEVPGFDAGFVGVDVFFVISGFLITRNLLSESESNGRTKLLSFWAKRIRRLVPAMTAMVLATLVGSVVVMSRVSWQEVARQGAAAALYVSNLLFARQSGDYFAGEIENSPFLHTWSLGVEEQFYLVWPFLFVIGVLVARRRVTALRPTLGVAFGIVLVGSFAYNVVLTGRGSTLAFFGLPTRAWEFAVAGLLALVPATVVPTRRARVVLSAAGVVLLLVALVVISPSTSYPGIAATLPVLAAALFVVGGSASADEPTALDRSLSQPSMQWVGRVSYSWYLWHWPFIILAVAAIETDSVGVRLGAALAALPVAVLAHRFVENPLRFSQRLVGSNVRTYGMGALATVLAVCTAFVISRSVVVDADGKAAEDQLIVAAEQLRGDPCADSMVTSPGGIEYCQKGEVGASKTVLLLGDSKARQWTNALAVAAQSEGVQLLQRELRACPFSPPKRGAAPKNDAQEECADFRAKSRRLIEELQPDAVLIAQSSSYGASTDQWYESVLADVNELRDAGIAVGLILDHPPLPDDAFACLERGGDVAACAPKTDEAVERIERAREAELAIVEELDVPFYDSMAPLCDESTCAVVVGDGVVAYADQKHLSSTYTLTQLEELERLLRQIT